MANEVREDWAGGRETFILRNWKVGGALVETEKLGETADLGAAGILMSPVWDTFSLKCL